LPGRIVLDDLEKLVKQERVNVQTNEGLTLLVEQLASSCPKAQNAIEQLRRFCWTDPLLPDSSVKTFERDHRP
jgi:hypothetical protein